MTLSHLDNGDNDSRVMTRDHVTQPQSCRHIQTEKILSLLAREPWRESKQSAPVILGYDTPTIGERRERHELLKQHRQRHPMSSSACCCCCCCPPRRQANYLVVKIICHQSLPGLSSHTQQPSQWNFLPSLSQTHPHIWPLFMRPPLLPRSLGCTGGDNCYIGSLSWAWWDTAPW